MKQILLMMAILLPPILFKWCIYIYAPLCFVSLALACCGTRLLMPKASKEKKDLVETAIFIMPFGTFFGMMKWF